MLSFSKKRKPEEDTYGTQNDAVYGGYTDEEYDPSYDGSAFGDEGTEGDTLGFAESEAIDQKPDPEPAKSTIKLMKFTSPADRKKVAECLLDGYAVVFNIDSLDRSEWYRVIDYLQGAIFMIGGTITRFSEYSLIAAPKNFDISKVEIGGLADGDNGSDSDEEDSDGNGNGENDEEEESVLGEDGEEDENA